MKMYLQIAARNLLQAKRRTLFLATALFSVTMLLVMLLSLSRGIRDNLILSATSLTAGHVNVAGFFKSGKDDIAPIVTGVSDIKRIVRENLDNVDFIIDRQRGWGKVVSETGSVQSGMIGLDIEEEQRLLELIQLARENEYIEGGQDAVLGKPEQLAEPGTAMLFASQAKRLGVTIGDALTIKTETLRGASNTVTVRVVAVARDIGLLSSWSVFIHNDTVRQLYALNDDTSGAVMIYLDDIEEADATMAKLRTVLEREGYGVLEHDPKPFFMKFETLIGEDWTGQKLDVTTWEDEVSFLTWIITAVDTVSFILVAVLTIIIIIGIMNTMYIAVRERTTEVGTLRAIGMSKRQILLMFMTEAVILGLVATTAGSLFGAAIAAGIDAASIEAPVDAMKIILMSDTINLSVTFTQVFGSIFAFTLITALSAVWPSVRASRLQPVTAIQHV